MLKKMLLYLFNCFCKILHFFCGRYRFVQKIESSVILKQDRSHVFRGYYDINHFNSNQSKILVHVLPVKEENNGEIEIGYYEIPQRNYVKVANSSAWSWQQGSRLRWVNDNLIIYNDFINGEYISRVYNINTKLEEEGFPFALYDVCFKKEYGLGLDFSRLQRLRPGYGYSNIADKTEGEAHPRDNGIVYHNLKEKTSELLFSLEELYYKSGTDFDGECYVNHICISPGGDKFLFFFICCNKSNTTSKVYAFTYSFTDEKLYLIEDKYRPSHYCWENGTDLILTLIDGRTEFYSRYKYNKKNGCRFGQDVLCSDGHPTSICNNEIITDTYPLRKKLNEQILYSFKNNKINKIARFSSDYKYKGERRCDLHPSCSAGYISLDTSCLGCRSVFVLKPEVLF